VLVSHDRHLIGLVSETFWRVADGRVESFKGDLDEYAVWLGARATKSAEPSPEPVAPGSKKAGSGARQLSRPASPSDQRPDLQTSGRRQQLAKLEEKLRDVTAELTALEAQLADPGLYANGGEDPGRVASRHAAVRLAHEALEAEWLDLYGQLEAS
jgi:ATP-binding cassette subfamily F protein 3